MRSIPVLYEDEYLIGFDKPAGILVIPAPGKSRAVLTDIVNARQRTGEGFRLHPCHRLDQETSGVILYAKGKKNQKIMMDIFHQKKVDKIYTAFVKGRVKVKSGVIRSRIKPYYVKRSGGESKAETAVTRYEVVNYGHGFSVIHAFPETGRTNQIRIHFSDLGHPLLGERVYAFRKDFDVDMKRLALHSSGIKFKHPVTAKGVEIHSELAEDMCIFLRQQGVKV